MGAFRRVEDRHAGPTAVGILVPPGPRTVVILRPRALPWDLLAVSPDDLGRDQPAFRSFDRDEAALLARRLKAELESARGRQADPFAVRPNPWGAGFVATLDCLGCLWIPCVRRPGASYQGALFPTEAEAAEAARQLAGYLCPGPDAEQEVYFNTQHFHGQP